MRRRISPKLPAVSGGEVGMKRIAFDDDFTTFDDIFPDAELGPSTGITLDQAKAGLIDDGSGALLVDTAAMVSAGASTGFDCVIYLGEEARAPMNLSFIMEMLGFATPGMAIMFGAYHLESGVPTFPVNAATFSSTGGLVAAGIGGDVDGVGTNVNKYFRQRFESSPLATDFFNNFIQFEMAVDVNGLGSRMGLTQSSTLSGVKSSTSWGSQELLGIRREISDTHVLRPCLVMQRDPDFDLQDDLKVRKLNLFYNPRGT